MIEKLIFDASSDENWAIGNPNYRYFIAVSGQANLSANHLSNYFKVYTSLPSDDSNILLLQNIDSNSFRVNIYDSDIVNDLATFKTWLSTHNVILYYVLNTPTYTIITEQALISQLEALQNQRSINGTNVITSECEEGLPVRIGVSALLKEVS